MVVKWEFYDPVTTVTTQFDVNPNEGGSPNLEKSITSHSTVASGGITILFEGNQPVQQITFSGVTRTEQQYIDLTTIFGKNHQVQLTDDLGRTFMIFIDSFEPQRASKKPAPWRHTYTVTATIVNWP